ncbi:acetate--CoA ligase [Methanofollis aquaemaris]|uniref:Acetate--CoA ligase n=1 Tax=Methanofollis aquaemaris TaxID=126734 RepID=A0A8A3S4R3_9EURY|nr:acetate--CoA ligase [Methanofollis aquaemaris]QSZ66626.1 acetate--CoA ligase [Methanofollis aquaemaris]
MTEQDFAVPLEAPKYYRPDPSYRERSWIGDYQTAYQKFVTNPEAFWKARAAELEWFEPFDEVMQWDFPYARWYLNGKINITYNCLDRHVKNGRANKVALFWRGEKGEEKAYTYSQLLRQVCRLANGLKRIGVKKGDRVCIYMPVIPEQVIAMLACARIGAVHSVVFGGFGVNALNQRIRDSGSRIVITADSSMRRGKAIQLKPIVEEAVVNAPSIETIIVLRRDDPRVELHSEMEVDFEELMENEPHTCEPEVMDAEDPLFLLYTSGTTGAPKGIVHACGGYAVGTQYTTKYVLDLKEDDVYWCTADPGWITGHSYVVYGPLLNGATVFFTESTPDYPDAGIWWKLIRDYGISVFYTAPTAIRMFMRVGEEWPAKYDLSSLRILASVGEPLNPEAFEWFYHHVGGGRCPIIDTWWQTETGMHMITTMVGEPMRPGFAGRPIPGVVADVVDQDGKSVEPGNGGYLVIQQPWPSMLRGVYHNDERYRKYWTTIDNVYTATDLAVKGHDGNIMVIGRADDLIIVAGHNIGTAEVESALVSHQAVAEAAVIGIPDPVKGNQIKAFVILRDGQARSDRLVSDLRYHVRMTVGPIAMPTEIEFVDTLPKTRSGKIMRRVLRAQELGMDLGDLSTLEE